MLTLMSWNVNGLRAARRKGFLDWLESARPDVLGLQETKCQPDQLEAVLRQPDGYTTYWASAERKGYSGVALYSHVAPQAVHIGLGLPEFDSEGRTISADYGDFVFITAYFPNGGSDLRRVPYKMAYKAAFLDYCNRLRASGRSVIFCGDVNTAHRPIDLARPRDNEGHTGFLPQERAWIDDVLAAGYLDAYRLLYPDQIGAYTWWHLVTAARARNVGWRLDYFFISPDLQPRLVDAAIHADVPGSDHCPVSLTLR